MTPTLPFTVKPSFIGVAAACILAVGGVGLAFVYHQATNPPPLNSAPAITSPDNEAAQLLLKQAFARLDGIPPEIKITGTLHLPGGEVYQLTEVASKHGQRVVGVTPSLPDEINTTSFSADINLQDENGKTRLIRFSLQDEPAKFARVSLRGFSSNTQGQLITGGGLTKDVANVDWSGQLLLNSAFQERNLFQIYITISPYEEYTVYAGDFLSYYLQSFIDPAADNMYQGVPEFPLNDEATTPFANKIAEELAGKGALGWPVNEKYILTRPFNDSCYRTCPIALYEKSLDGWTEIFQTDANSIWLTQSTLGKAGDILYTEDTPPEKTAWQFFDGAYRPYQEGAPSP